eukprot:TRINITY_DN830_c0_g3_i2.p1 TRINITY_DN830_c0_g3~~TRINITY_DN830_c0_g3_i2.p1  ORF type:complete len:457 (+),score=65.03 TRINITY_DN830_c0_g3_i2:158-1528(+)
MKRHRGECDHPSTKKSKVEAPTLVFEVIVGIAQQLESDWDPTFISFALTCKKLLPLLGESKVKVLRNEAKYCHLIASKGYFNLLYWALDQKYPADYHVCSEAAKFSNGLQFLKWAFQNNLHVSYTCASTAAENGHVETLKWLSDNVECDAGVLAYAIRGSQVNVINWFHKEKGSIAVPSGIDKKFAKCRDSRIWRWVVEEAHEPLDLNKIFTRAGYHGNLDLTRWLLENHERFPQVVSQDLEVDLKPAILANKVEVVKFWFENWRHFGVEIEETGLVSSAVVAGNLELVKWLRKEKECPWDGSECTKAVRHGSIEILNFLREGDDPAPWNEETFSVAASTTPEILKWLQNNGCPTCTILCSAGTYGNLECVKFAREEMGESWDEEFIPAALSLERCKSEPHDLWPFKRTVVDEKKLERCILWARDNGVTSFLYFFASFPYFLFLLFFYLILPLFYP